MVAKKDCNFYWIQWLGRVQKPLPRYFLMLKWKLGICICYVLENPVLDVKKRWFPPTEWWLTKCRKQCTESFQIFDMYGFKKTKFLSEFAFGSTQIMKIKKRWRFKIRGDKKVPDSKHMRGFPIIHIYILHTLFLNRILEEERIFWVERYIPDLILD